MSTTAEDDHDEAKIPMPPAYAPRAPSRIETSNQKAPSVTSAKSFPKQPPMNPGYIASKSTNEHTSTMKKSIPSDFPGVAMPLPSPSAQERTATPKQNEPKAFAPEVPRVSTPTTTAVAPAPVAVAAPEPKKLLAPKPVVSTTKPVEVTTTKHVVTAPSAPNVRSPRPPVAPHEPKEKMPLGVSSSHNIVNDGETTPRGQAEKLLKRCEEMSTKPRNSRPETVPKETKKSDELDESIKQKLEDAKRIEVELKRVVDEKEALERKVKQLEKDNNKLKEIAREASRYNPDVEWTEEDEKEFLASRKDRLDAQTLVQEPILQHLEQVNYIYDIKNQWCQSDKPQFDLSFPRVFQRAEDLNIRDKTKEEEDESKKKLLILKEDKKSKSKALAPVQPTAKTEVPKQRRQRVVEPIVTKPKDFNVKPPSSQGQKENSMNRSSLAKLKRLTAGKGKH